MLLKQKLLVAPPTAPVDPHSQSIGSNFVALSWTKPISDGGKRSFEK